MSLASVKAYFKTLGLEARVVTLDQSTATVEEAAAAHGVAPDQIAKTIALKIKEAPLLIVVSGNSRLDNKKYKATFSAKAKFLSHDEALEWTGHIIGGICPFGLEKDMPVYLDGSLKKHQEVIPAAGDRNSAIKLSIEELEQYSKCVKWVDVCQ